MQNQIEFNFFKEKSKKSSIVLEVISVISMIFFMSTVAFVCVNKVKNGNTNELYKQEGVIYNFPPIYTDLDTKYNIMDKEVVNLVNRAITDSQLIKNLPLPENPIKKGLSTIEPLSSNIQENKVCLYQKDSGMMCLYSFPIIGKVFYDGTVKKFQSAIKIEFTQDITNKVLVKTTVNNWKLIKE